jgi:hypothetical protein
LLNGASHSSTYLPGPLYAPDSIDLDESLGGGLGAGGMYYEPYSAHQLLPDDIVSETDHVLMELNHQRSLRENFERRMEQKLAALEGENNMLKRMFLESHHKNAVMQERMERVMKTLYTMFMGGGNAPGLALTNRTPVRFYFTLLDLLFPQECAWSSQSMLLTDMEHFAEHRQQGDEGGGCAADGAGSSSREVTVLDSGSGGPGQGE